MMGGWEEYGFNNQGDCVSSVMVVVAAVSESLSDDLLRVADRYIEIDSQWLTSMKVG